MQMPQQNREIFKPTFHPRLWFAALCAVSAISVGFVSDPIAAEPAETTVYARNELLAEASELGKLRSRPGTRLVLDARTAEKYQEQHLKDAVHVVPADWSKEFGDGQNTEIWSRRFGQLGIGRDTEVIVYDDRTSQDAARVWWYLRYWGVCQARIVNGGWKAIQSAGLPLESGASRVPVTATYSSPPVATRRIGLAALIAANKKGRLATEHADSLQLVDTRSEKEYRGEQVTEGLRPGTIPGSRHLEWADLVDVNSERFRPTEEVQTLLKARGIHLDRPIVAFSNTRGRSSSIAFPLELAGATQTRIFDSGIKSWASDPENPVIAPKP